MDEFNDGMLSCNVSLKRDCNCRVQTGLLEYGTASLVIDYEVELELMTG